MVEKLPDRLGNRYVVRTEAPLEIRSLNVGVTASPRQKRYPIARPAYRGRRRVLTQNEGPVTVAGSTSAAGEYQLVVD